MSAEDLTGVALLRWITHASGKVILALGTGRGWGEGGGEGSVFLHGSPSTGLLECFHSTAAPFPQDRFLP